MGRHLGEGQSLRNLRDRLAQDFMDRCWLSRWSGYPAVLLMARSNAVACIHNTHKEEGSFTKSGGWTIIRSDPGNWTGGKVGVGVLKGTKYGIAANTYPNLDIKNLTMAEADAIYIRDYWPKAWGDAWPEGFDQVTYDATVNSGPGRGPLWTCRALGFANANKAATTKAHMLPVNDKVSAIKRAVAIRMGFLRSLGTFSIFGKGWTGRCARMEAIGVKMALVAAKLSAPEVKKKLEKEGTKADGAKNGNVASGGGGTVAGGSVIVQNPGWDWVNISIGAVVIATLIFVSYRAYVNYQRKKAYLDAAQAV
jgi:lysozyme family protein